MISMLFMYNVLIHSQLYNQSNPEAHSATATMSASPATDAAMSTTELLERVLSHLGVEYLILLRRVSRHWRDVMAGSLVLQRAMFLAPEPELPFEWYLQWMNFGEPWRYIKKTSGAVLEHDETVVMKSSRFNPVLYKRRPKVESRGVSNGWQSVRLYIRNNALTAGGTSLFPQMFITQPRSLTLLSATKSNFITNTSSGSRTSSGLWNRSMDLHASRIRVPCHLSSPERCFPARRKRQRA
jgi:hypothetical protein